MAIDLDELERLAKNAASGPWVQSECIVYGGECKEGEWEMVIYDEGGHTEDDAAFIAAANPQTILELIRMIREKK